MLNLILIKYQFKLLKNIKKTILLKNSLLELSIA